MEEKDKLVVKIADFGLVTIHKYAEQLHKWGVGHIKYLAHEVRYATTYETRAHIYGLEMVSNDLFDVYSDEE